MADRVCGDGRRLKDMGDGTLAEVVVVKGDGGGAAFPAQSSSMVLSRDTTVTGPSAQSAINVDLLTGVVGGWLDVSAFRSATIMIIGSVGITAGSIIFEQTNDTALAPSGVNVPVSERITIANTELRGNIAIAASAVRVFEVPLHCNFVRVRNSVAFVGGTVQAVACLSQIPISLTSLQALNATAANLNVQATLAASTVRAGFISGAGIWWDDSSTALAAGASYTGTFRDLIAAATATAIASASAYPKEFRVSAESDQTGTLWAEYSRDGTTGRRVKSIGTAAVSGGGYAAEIIIRPSWRYLRVGYTNGPTLQARFTIGSVAVAA